MAQFGIDWEETISRFNYRPPTDEQIARMNEIRAACKAAAGTILGHAPQCAERTLALRWLHQANMEANVAVMFNEFKG